MISKSYPKTAISCSKNQYGKLSSESYDIVAGSATACMQLWRFTGCDSYVDDALTNNVCTEINRFAEFNSPLLTVSSRRFLIAKLGKSEALLNSEAGHPVKNGYRLTPI